MIFQRKIQVSHAHCRETNANMDGTHLKSVVSAQAGGRCGENTHGGGAMLVANTSAATKDIDISGV